MIKMPLDISFTLAIIVAAHLGVVQSHLCVLEKRPDPSRGGALRWSLPFAEICLCQGVVAPIRGKTCRRKDVHYEEGELWFVDDPRPLTMRHNWEKDILDDLLDRTTYCRCTLGTDNCDINAACTNIPVGSFTCACNAGYKGDGVTCTDIDECVLSPEKCDANAVCANTVGSFTCACNVGYSGDGVTCTEIDECAVSPENCDANAVCTNTVGSFTCACNDGYIGDGVTCADINECALSPDNCDVNAVCTNTVGSFTCACNDGYNGDGVTCTDIDECAVSPDNCDANAVCTNTVGSFTCACNDGYSGDGVTCAVCIDYLGMENGTIPNVNIIASSEYASRVASKGRLNGPSYWTAAYGQTGPIWIQADIGYQTYVSGVITQGNGGNNWVTSFSVSTFETTDANQMFVEDQNGNAIIFPGNVNGYSDVITIFPEPVHARIVRINCLTKIYNNSYYVLRFEILGCKQG